jgi:predicted ATPase
MLITKIEATNLLSFEHISIDLTQGLNVIVGPNAAGKSNVIALVSLLAKALAAQAVYEPRSASSLRDEATTYLRSGHDSGMLRVAVEFDSADDGTPTSAETELIDEFFLAFIASNVQARLRELQSINSVESAELAYNVGRAWITSHLQDALYSGVFVLIINRNPSFWIQVGFEFTYNDHAYIYSLVDHRVYYDEQVFASGASSTGLLPFRNGVTLAGEEPQIDLPFDGFLPKGDTESCSWEIVKDPSRTGSGPWLAGLQRVFGYRQNYAPEYSLGEVLVKLYTSKVVSTDNLRRPPRRDYPIARLAQSRPISDGEEVPLRLLQMKDHSIQNYQDRFLAIQEMFKKLTDRRFGVAASYVAAGDPSLADEVRQQSVFIDVFVLENEGQVRIDRAGSGFWETLFLATLLHQEPGSVVFLDEPAVNMHPTLQRKVLTQFSALNQAVITTHSPYLVPSGNAKDLDRVMRLHRSAGATKLARVSGGGKTITSRSVQIHTQPETRSMLFASGVLLVEGETDADVFHRWFNDPTVTSVSATLDDNNYQIVSVGGDRSFRGFVDYLDAFAIPWAIICDGPVMSPNYEMSLTEQLTVIAQDDNPPNESAPFEDWKVYWESHGVFTVAREFGLKTKAGEIEAFLSKMDAALWREACKEAHNGKVRKGSYFADKAVLAEHSDELGILKDIYRGLVLWLQRA